MTEKYMCPCCDKHTLDEKDFYCICPVCGWEDDPGQHEYPDDPIGANEMSLNEARKAFRAGRRIV